MRTEEIYHIENALSEIEQMEIELNQFTKSVALPNLNLEEFEDKNDVITDDEYNALFADRDQPSNIILD